MNFNSIKNNLSHWLEIIFDKIRNSTLYNIFLEKYENLESYQQFWIQRFFLLLFIIGVLFLPLSFLFNSLQEDSEFKEKKQLSLSLLKDESQQFLSKGISSPQFEKKLSQIVDELSLSPEQEVYISQASSRIPLPSSFHKLPYYGKKISITKLNIEEVIEIGNKFDKIDSSVKLIQIKIIETKEKENYFDVNYTILHFPPPKNTIKLDS